MPDASANVTIPNKLGLHARPATLFAETALQFDSDITICREGSEEQIDGKSIMQMLMLAATCGTVVTIAATGSDAAKAVEKLTALVKSGFDEE